MGGTGHGSVKRHYWSEAIPGKAAPVHSAGTVFDRYRNAGCLKRLITSATAVFVARQSTRFPSKRGWHNVAQASRNPLGEASRLDLGSGGKIFPHCLF